MKHLMKSIAATSVEKGITSALQHEHFTVITKCFSCYIDIEMSHLITRNFSCVNNIFTLL